jgi:hypothetical protein
VTDADDPSSDPEPIDLGTLDEIRPGAWFAPGRQMVVNDQLVVGLRFSHHITQAELVEGWLEVVPDFAAIAAFAHRAELEGGGAVEVVELELGDATSQQVSPLVITGPEGWLDAGAAGATAVLSLSEGRLQLTWAPPFGEVDLDPTPVVATFEQLGAGDPVPLLDLVLHLLIEHRGLFEVETPLPLRDLLLVAGLDVEGTTVVRAGVRQAARGAEPAGLPGLGISSALAAERLLAVAVDPEREGAVGPDVLEALADPDAVAAVAEQLVGGAIVSVERFAALVDALEAGADAARRPAVAFLRSRLAEWQGDSAAQELALGPAVSSGRQPAALVDAAWFAADRGDARGALALLRSAHVPADDPDLHLLTRYTANGPRWVGRNDPCWCGSGRKHKQCHLQLNGHDLDSRVAWLHAKAVMFLQRPPQRADLLAVATTSAGLSSPDDAPARVIAAACDATVAELCLFEGGAFARFVEQRGSLLPDDERELAERWADQRHRVWEVSGDGTTLRDPATGDERELDAWSQAKVAPGFVLAVAQAGPIALPGPATGVVPALVEELSSLLAAGEVHPLAALLGRELGWTSAPDLGSTTDPAPDELAPTS